MIRPRRIDEYRAMTTSTLTEPVTTVQRLYAAFGARDQAAVLALLDEDVDWSREVSAPGAELVPMLHNGRGHDAVRAYFAGVAQLEMLAFEPMRFLTDGRTVLVQLRIHVRHPGTSKDVDMDEIHRWEVGDDGRIVQYRPYTDTAGLIDIYRT
jgi:ketosteroid isomerase-like protein